MLSWGFAKSIKRRSQRLHRAREIIKRATIAKDGKLTEKFAYLQNYVDGK